MHIAHRLVRFFARSFARWYEREQVIRQLERLGKLGTGLSIGGPILFGRPEQVQIADDVSINGLQVKGSGLLRIGSHVHIGEDVLILTENHKYERMECLPYGRERITEGVTIGDSVWICDRVTIIPGVTIGEGAILGAGAVVSRDVAPLAIVGGAPAKAIRSRDSEEYWRLKAGGNFLGWPQSHDMICGKRMLVKRR
jgi:acetyltransferase-like isoleucine patch superfamily enzyme